MKSGLLTRINLTRAYKGYKKKIEESEKKNLQIFKTLKMLVFNAIIPVITCFKHRILDIF